MMKHRRLLALPKKTSCPKLLRAKTVSCPKIKTASCPKIKLALPSYKKVSVISKIMAATMAVTVILAPLTQVKALVGDINVTESTADKPIVEIVRNNSEGGTIEEADTIATLSGDDIQRTTIRISNLDELKEFAKNCRLDTWSQDKYVELTDDIVISSSSGFKYIPTFGGIFNGNGHTISGVLVTNAESYTGLFCQTQSCAKIYNLNVDGSLIPTGKQKATGGIVGDNYGEITACTFLGNLTGYDFTGGIAGYNEESGVINGCKSSGYVKGMHFTGGITGYNLGIISGCTNSCKVNITSDDEQSGLSDIDPDQLANNWLSQLTDKNSKDSTSVVNTSTDTGGICGYSSGKIISCVNDGLIGYEHVGYNVGGIVGRQNGYVELCTNNGEVYGRKDVGGIVGQAEPYIVVDLTDDIIKQLTDNMNTLHDLVNVTLNDASGESDLITARLNVVKGFTDRALDDTGYLTNETEDYINNVVDAGNQVIERIDYALDESAKNGGVFDKTKDAVSNARDAATHLSNTVNDLDLYKYMSAEEIEKYEQAKKNIEQATEDYDRWRKELEDEYYNYYYYQYINKNKTESMNLVPYDNDGNIISWPGENAEKSEYESIKGVCHYDEATDPPTVTDFPAEEGEYANVDSALDSAAKASAEGKIQDKLDAKFVEKYGKSYTIYIEENTKVIADIIVAHEAEMTESARKDARKAIDSAKSSLTNLEAAVGETKSIVSNINSRPDIQMPKLSEEYKARSNSLIANIQGMSDNLGFLNNEMNASNQTLVDDMKEVNDEFNVIMLLIADAIDGVLDMDYTDVYQDNSEEFAEECTDATIADSINNGSVHGDIDTSGIVGTMAIEYDFDLESDVTGIDDAKMSTTYKTKCVVRKNTNRGRIEGVKSYVGGIVGLQEMGMVLHNQNYGTLKSNSGDYVGGIVGKSMSIITQNQAKGVLAGRKYIGGITGYGYDIARCIAMPTIMDADSYTGAIAGDNNPDGRLNANYFVSEECAGIDRISYSGKAEPISYSDLMGMEDIPEDYKRLNITFLMDDEVVGTTQLRYGEPVSVIEIPEVSSIEKGSYAKWELPEEENIFSDIEITGESTRYLTTIASIQVRKNNQSAVLVDGNFVEGDILVTEVVSGAGEIDSIKLPDMGTGATDAEASEESSRVNELMDKLNKGGNNKRLETWTVKIPNDGASEHMFRYQMPDGVEDVKISVVKGSEVIEPEITKMGKFLTFSATGDKVSFVVEDTTKPLVYKYKYYIAGGSAALILLIAIITVNVRRKRRFRKSVDAA